MYFRHAKNLSWMRRPDYISTEQTRFQPTTIEKIESKVGFAVRKKMDAQSLFMDRESQIAAIEKTFEASVNICQTAKSLISRGANTSCSTVSRTLSCRSRSTTARRACTPSKSTTSCRTTRCGSTPARRYHISHHMESFSYPEQFL